MRSATLIFSGNIASAVLLLCRTLLVARLVSVEDYGVAATFLVVMTFVEMLSALGLQQQIVQSEDGENPRFQAGLQGFQLLRGCIAALIMFAMAAPVADFLGAPQAVDAYRWLSLVPLFNGLVHFDVYRLNRRMQFGPIILSQTVPPLISLMLIWPLAIWLEDYRTLLWAMLVHMGLTSVISHLMAQQPYRVLLDREIMARSLRFGWPILINGALLFAIFHGDKVIVARYFGLSDLAIFAMGFTLTLTPTLVVERSTQTLFLPQLSKALSAPSDRARYAALSATVLEINLAAASILVIGCLVLGAPFIHFVLGEKYAPLIALLPWFAVLQGLRLAKSAVSAPSLAMAHTGIGTLLNLPRVATLPLAAWLALTTGEPLLIVWVAILSELGSLGWMLVLMRRSLGLPIRPMIGPIVTTLVLMAIAILPLPWGLVPKELFVIALFILSLSTMRSLRGYLRSPGH